MQQKLKVGQKVWVKFYGRNVFESTISEVGRIYFKLEDVRHQRFIVKTLLADSSWCPEDKVYLSLQDYQTYKESSMLTKEIKRFINAYDFNPTLEQIREIAKILGIETQNKTLT